MLNNKTFRVIASLVVAVLLWAYVIGTQNTTSNQDINNIPITFTHTVELNERGLAVSSMNLESIDVEVTGTRMLLSEISANDVTATVDLATAAKGENDLNIVVRVPSGIRVNDRSATKVTVIIEDLVQKQVDVTINYTGTFDEGQEGDTISIATPQVTVSGAESVVNMVANVRGTVDASRLSEDPTEITCQLQAVNSDGNPVAGVVLSQESVTVKSILSETKSVPVNVEVVDNSSDGMVRKTEVSDTIAIVGRADLLSGVEEINAKPVDITNISDEQDIKLEFELPDGISLSDRNDDSDLMLHLTVAPVTSKSFTYNVSDIEISGVSNRQEYTAPSGTQIVVTIMDSAEVLARINKGALTLSCDVTGLAAGTSVVGIGINCDTDLYMIEPEPETIEITVTETETAASRIQTALIAATNNAVNGTNGSNATGTANGANGNSGTNTSNG